MTDKEISREDYLKLKGLRTMHDEFKEKDKYCGEVATEILNKYGIEDKVIGDIGMDAMWDDKGLDKWLSERDIEVEEVD